MPISVQVVNSQSEVIETFSSLVELAKHVGIGVYRVKTYLKERTIINIADLEHLYQLARTPRNWDHAGKNRRKNHGNA